MARPLAPACLRQDGTVDPTALLGSSALPSGQLPSATLVAAPVTTNAPLGAPSSTSFGLHPTPIMFGLTIVALTPFPAALQPYVTAPGTSYGIPPPLVPPSPPSSAVVTMCVFLYDGHHVRGIFVSFDQAMNPVLRDCVELSSTPRSTVTYLDPLSSSVL